MSRGDSILRNSTTSDGKRYSEITPLIESNGNSAGAQINKNPSPELAVGVSWGVAAFLLVNTALGAGMLNYPYAYNQIGGVLAAALTQIVLLVFISSTMFILVYCADFNQDDTYHDVLLSMCGKRAQQISAISILLTCYGINITFLVIIGDQYDRIFNSLLFEYLDEYWFLDRKFTIFITSILFIWPMCYAQRLDFLRHASILGMFAMLYVAFLTVYEHYKLDAKTIVETISYANSTTLNTTALEHFKPKHHSVLWFEPLAIIPVLCFAYQTHEVIVPVYACMKERSIGHFMKASFFGLVILFFLYNLVGAYGYLTFGANVDADIMSLYDAKDPVVIVGVVALVVKFITTYPPLMFCGRGALDGLYGELRKLSASEFKSTEKVRRIIISTAWFFSTVALALFAPDISVTLQLLGSMASINVFVFPGMCLVSLTRRLRRARLTLMIDDTNDYANQQQRAKDYYVISGSYFGAMKKNAARAEYNNQHHSYNNQHQVLTNGSNRRNFTATFASLIEFETSASSRYYGDYNGSVRQQQKLNGYGTQIRHQRRQEEFDKLLTNGNTSAQDQISSFNNSINGSLDNNTAAADNINSWNNRSTTGSILERLGSSIAPSTVAQIGISRSAAFGLYLFSAILIVFGTFIFVLELVNVLGLL